MGTSIMNLKTVGLYALEILKVVVVSLTMFALGYMVHTRFGRHTMMTIFAVFFCLCTLYLMYKNLMVYLTDGEGSIWWLSALTGSAALTIYALTKVTSYFDIH